MLRVNGAAAIRACGQRGLAPAAAAARLAGPLQLAVRGKQMEYRSNKPLPVLDIEMLLKKSASVEVHNPLLVIERQEKAERARRAEEIREAQRAYIPDIRGSHPLELELQYRKCRDEFYAARDGILSTPTRRYASTNEIPESTNPKKAFGVVQVFAAHQDNVRLTGDERRYSNEFAFSRPPSSIVGFLGHLQLYVQTLHALPESSRKKYFDDFYYIIKALRQRPKTHKKVMGNSEFYKLIMAYFLLCGQNNLALFAASLIVPKVVPQLLDRWILARILDLRQMYEPQKQQIESIQTIEEGGDPDENTPIKSEYQNNLLVHNIMAYYYNHPGMTVTDVELIHLVRCTEARKLKTDLMDLLPLLVRRLANGLPEDLPVADYVQLYYDPKVRTLRSNELQLGARYALALLRTVSVEAAVRFLRTMADMPPRPIPGTASDTRAIAQHLVGAALKDKAPELLLQKVLSVLAKNPVENAGHSADMQGVLAHLSGWMSASQQSSGSLSADQVLSELVSLMGLRLSGAEAMQNIKKLDGTSTAGALQWAGTAFGQLDGDGRDWVVGWALGKLQDNRSTVTAFIQKFARESPVPAARLVHALTRRLWDRESDRRAVQTKASGEIMRSSNAQAIGLSLVTAALGPELQVVSAFGPQSVGERTRAVAGLVGSIGRRAPLSLPVLLSYLFKAAGSLHARETERGLWREVLRRGVTHTRQMLQAALSLRLGGGGAGAGHEQAVELVEHALREYPAVGGARLAPAASAMYMTILNGLNRGGKGAAFDMLAEYLLKSGQLDTRTFGALVSAWLDAIGRRPGATCTDVQRTWDTLQSHAASMTPAYELNRNHYHSAIEAYVRLGDVAAAWNVIRTAMRDAGLAPDLDTFYTLASPLASNTALWAVGKSTVANFNTHYPDVVNAALADKTNTLVVKALLHQAIAKPERT